MKPSLQSRGTLAIYGKRRSFWQVSGRNDTGYEERVALDTHFVCNWSV